MKKTLALILSILMILSTASLFAFAETSDVPVITDGTTNASGAVVRNQSAASTAVPAVGVSDGTVWNGRTPETVWTYDEGLEQLQKSNTTAESVYPTIKVNQGDGTTVDVQVYGSRAKFASPTMLTSFDVLFESKTTESRKTYINGSKLYASVDGEIWDELYTFADVAAATTHVPVTVEGNTNFYNYVALYTSVNDNNLCRLMMIIPYGYTEAQALGATVVESYGQVSKFENDPSQTSHNRGFDTQQGIWENAGEVQYQAENFDTPHTLALTDGTNAQGYGAAAKLATPSVVKFFAVNRNGSNGTARSWGQYWGDMTLYGSTDGGDTWMAISKPGAVTHTYYTNYHSFAVYEEYANTVFTDVALLTTVAFRIRQAIAYGAPATPDGEALQNLKTVDDGTKWISENDDVGSFREPEDMWENHKLFQWESKNTYSIGAMGFGASAQLEYPTKLTGFELKLDTQSGKEFWKERANYLAVYASVDGVEWVKLHTVSGLAQNTTDISYVIHVEDDTLYNYVGIYTSRADLGMRLKDVIAYGESNGEAMTLQGYQMRYYTDDNGVARCAVRFVATVDEVALNNQTLGFDIVTTYVKNGVDGSQTFDVTTTSVYQSIVANGEVLTVADVAPDSGHEYIVLGTVKDINRANYDYVTFNVTPYVINEAGDKISSAPMKVTPATGYPYSDWTINGNSIKDYTIVAPTDGILNTTVEAFRDELKLLSGYELPIVSAENAETGLEILIGETGRAATASVTRPQALNYTIAMSGNKLVIRTGGEHSLELLMAEFFEVVTCGTNEALTMDGAYSVSGNYYDDPYANTQAVANTDVRVMSANVLLHDPYKASGDYYYDCAAYPELNTYESGTFEFERRVEIFMASLDYYKPDVVGVQEFCYHWVDEVQKYIDATDNDYYANWKIVVFDSAIASDGNVCSGILYRTDKLTMTDSGTEQYTDHNNRRGQYITWADFTVQATGEVFSFVSTHWGVEAVVESQSAQLAEFVNAKSGTVITTGDFNQNADSDIYKGFLTITGSVDAKTNAATKINQTGSWHEWAGTTNSKGSIDHITANNGCSILSYETVFYNQQIYGSDHAWIVADLTIGG